MKIDDEIRKVFENHKASFRDLGEVQILDWKKDNTICCSIRYIFDGNMLYISGDYGCAVYWLTWKGTPQSFKNINLGYFYEKNEAHEDEEYEFNSEKAKEDIEEYLSFIFEDYENFKKEKEEEIKDIEKEKSELDRKDYDSDEDYEDAIEGCNDDIQSCKDEIDSYYDDEDMKKKLDLKQQLLDLIDECSSLSQWSCLLAENNIVDELEEYDCDCWEWIYSIGKSIPARTELHLAGLILANEYLENNK